ncbi:MULTISPECIES: cortex morphogenetic protein CmpA [Cohnella]|nr:MULTISPECIES: cortex morphogenetic protein CmpA [Cohnella]MBN2980162.1 cortex morphogenetic protein CmpA [Cohnella algarum]
MPQWLCNQLMRAYLKKDRRQIKMLNDCWFFYQRQTPSQQTTATRSQH